MPTAADRIAELEHQVAELAAGMAQMSEVVQAFVAKAAREIPSVTLMAAAKDMKISPEAALKRARRAAASGKGHVVKVDGRWVFSRAYVDAEMIMREAARRR